VFAAGAATSAPPDLPVVPESAKPRLRLLTRGAEGPDDAELDANPRSASVRLRAAERVREAA
jgi:16S rRNA (cytosine1402-N4)-methyltransferase